MNLAHATHLFLKRHVAPTLRPLGTVRRRGKLGSSVVANRLALRTSLFLCVACEHKMPRQWLRQYEYRLIQNMYADATRCDACQDMTSTNVYVAEDQGYYQQYKKLHQITEHAQAQQRLIREGKRIPGR